MLTQREIRREADGRLPSIRDDVAVQNLMSMIAADEVARFMTQPMDLGKFDAPAADLKRLPS